MSSEPGRHQRVSELFLAACELPEHDRSAFLEDRCAGDDALRTQVEQLLALDVSSDLFDTPSDSHLGDEADHFIASSPDPSTSHVGHYRLLEVIGEGGMGIVYRAEQENPRRVVALKLIRPGICSSRMLRRFRIEAEALGRLRHHGIAQIYEASTFEASGRSQPYFAMEYVDGAPLLQYAEQHGGRGLGTRRRLALLMKLCDAVDHAHRNGVIHRDLKPANIIVDNSGQPKILDFGVARLTDADIQMTSLATEFRQIVGTVPYMSPEQVAGDATDAGRGLVDARCDVYALGVIGYELLTGRLPYELAGRTLPEAVRIICEDGPTPLSSINRTFRGDLDTILTKALEKDPQRRYDSAAALGEDIRRYLDSEPIVARPPTTTYQLRKFAQRHRAVVVSLVLAFVGLSALSIVAMSQALRAMNAEARALEEAQEALRQSEVATAVNEFLNRDLLAAVAPSSEMGRGRDVLMRDVLDVASDRIAEAASLGGRFADMPLVVATIRAILGETYFKLGEYDQALPHMQNAVELFQTTVGESDPQAIAVVNNLAVVLGAMGRYEEAEEAYLAAIAGRERVLGDDAPLTLSTRNSYAVFLRGRNRLDEAEPLARAVLQRRMAVLGEDDPDTLQSLQTLAGILRSRGDVEGALPLYKSVLQSRRRLLGDDDPDTLSAMSNLASLLDILGRFGESDPLHRELIERREAVLGEGHPNTLRAYNNFARFLQLQDRNAEAEEFFRRAHTGRAEALGEDHPTTLLTLNNLAHALAKLERWDEALACSQRAADGLERRLGADHDHTLIAHANMGRALAGLGRFDEAIHHCRIATDGFLRIRGEDHHFTRTAMIDLAEVLFRADRADDAVRVLHEVLARFEASGDASHPEAIRARSHLSQVAR